MKMPLRDDDDSDCLPRLLECCIYVSSYFAHVLTRRGVYSRAAFISLSASNYAAFIQGRRLFKGGVYSRKYGLPNRTRILQMTAILVQLLLSLVM